MYFFRFLIEIFLELLVILHKIFELNFHVDYSLHFMFIIPFINPLETVDNVFDARLVFVDELYVRLDFTLLFGSFVITFFNFSAYFICQGQSSFQNLPLLRFIYEQFFNGIEFLDEIVYLFVIVIGFGLYFFNFGTDSFDFVLQPFYDKGVYTPRATTTSRFTFG